MLAMEALKLGLTGADSHGDRYLAPQDPGREFLLQHHLLNVADVALMVQCKSGLDRTLIMVSLVVAADAFHRTAGHHYDPRGKASDEDEALFNGFFTQAADSLGTSCIHDVRGLHGKAKWGFEGRGKATSPVVAQHYLDAADGPRAAPVKVKNPVKQTPPAP